MAYIVTDINGAERVKQKQKQKQGIIPLFLFCLAIGFVKLKAIAILVNLVLRNLKFVFRIFQKNT